MCIVNGCERMAASGGLYPDGLCAFHADIWCDGRTLFLAGWSDYEESAHLEIREGSDGLLYAHHDGHCVMVEDNSPTIHIVDQDEALDRMLDMAEYEDTDA